MYLWIPLLMILGLLIGIFLIILKKMPYLKKLPTETEQDINGNFWHDLFPEAFHCCRKIDFISYRQQFFKELEKFLRRLRVTSLKLEHLASSLISKVNKAQAKNQLTGRPWRASPLAGESVLENQAGGQLITPPASNSVNNAFDPKKKEQSLIIEIAKNPKKTELYRQLGDVYIALKNLTDARKSFEMILKLDPEDLKAKEKLELIDKLMLNQPETKKQKPT